MKNTCIYCGREINNRGSLAAHEKVCKYNPSPSLHSRSQLFRTPESESKRIARYKEALALHKSQEGYERKYTRNPLSTGRGATPELESLRRQRISEGMKKHGGYREGSGRGKKGWCRGTFCDSSWELAYVLYNTDHNITFSRNSKKFEYEWEGKKHKYLPDFINEKGSYVEIKGYFTPQFQAKRNQFPAEEVLTILDEEAMKPYIDYATRTYGKDFIKLYELEGHTEGRRELT